jgi:two-component SAPR family response regulator
VVLCTAYPNYKSESSTWESDAYVIKSSDPRKLKNTVKSVFERIHRICITAA